MEEQFHSFSISSLTFEFRVIIFFTFCRRIMVQAKYFRIIYRWINKKKNCVISIIRQTLVYACTVLPRTTQFGLYADSSLEKFRRSFRIYLACRYNFCRHGEYERRERTFRSCKLNPRKSSLRRRSNRQSNLGKRWNDQCVPASYTAISFFSASIFCDEGRMLFQLHGFPCTRTVASLKQALFKGATVFSNIKFLRAITRPRIFMHVRIFLDIINKNCDLDTLGNTVSYILWIFALESFS